MKQIITLLLAGFFSLAMAGTFLTPDKAFVPYAKTDSDMQILTGIKIASDIYLYESKVTLKLLDANGISIKDVKAPKSVDHDGEQVYLISPEFVVTLTKDKSVSGVQNVTLVMSYQGCSQEGLCYQPYKKEFSLEINSDLLSSSLGKLTVPKELKKIEKKVVKDVKELSETDTIAKSIKSSSVLIVLFTFFVFGILLSLTPCVFPMIPIISGVIISHGHGLSTKKAFLLSVVYVLAMAVAYTIAGVLAGLFGSNLQAALQTPWVIYSFSGIFVLLALSMFGFYELKLPDSLVAKVSANSQRGGYIGIAIMGFLSALIVGPCVAAPLAGALVYIGQTGDALLGGAALFSMSIGMGIPLIVVGVSAGKFMPRPGAWMSMVSAIFGMMMLGVAIWMLEKILDPSTTMLLYALLGLACSLYLGAFQSEGHIFKRSVSIVLFIYSVALFIGFLAGSSSMSRPLGFLHASTTTALIAQEPKELEFEVIRSIEELNSALAKNKGKKIMLDFSAEWCVACKEFEEITFIDAKVKEKMSEFILIRADVTDNGEDAQELSHEYGVYGPPAILFFNEKSELQKSKTVVGFMEPDEFLLQLGKI